MGLWRYRCIRCGEKVREQQDGAGGGWIRFGAICPRCTRKIMAQFWDMAGDAGRGETMIDAMCVDCAKEGRQRIAAHNAKNGDPVCNTHFLQRMRTPAEPAAAAGLDGLAKDVLSALCNLGYDKVRAQTALAEAEKNRGSSPRVFEELLKASLWVLKNPGAPSAAAFLADPEAIERDHAARTGEKATPVDRRAKPNWARMEREDVETDGEMDDDPEEDDVAERAKRANVDWVKVQNERSGGTSVPALAAKYGISQPTIYAHTKPAGTSRRDPAVRHAADVAKAEKSRPEKAGPSRGVRDDNGSGSAERRSPAREDGGVFTDLLADLRRQREAFAKRLTAMDAAIEALAQAE